MTPEWTKLVRLHELDRGPVTLQLEPEAEQRARIAAYLKIQSLPSLKARVTVKPWFDGAEIAARFDAVVEQICSVTLDPFEQPLRGEFEVRVVPQGSPHAPGKEGGEVELDLDAPDPPDVLEDEAVDVAAYVIEHLALEIDPFARKPGATFDYTPATEETSPFAALKKLQDPKP